MEKRSEDKRMKKGEWESSCEIMIIFILCLVFAFIWYYPFRNGILAGDDWGIPYIFGTSKNNLYLIFRLDEKYRPIANIGWLILYRLCGTNYQGYLILALILHSLSATSIFYGVKKNAQNSLYAICATIIFECSFLAFYNNIQAIGLLENMCIFFLIWIVYSTVELYNTQKKRYIIYDVILLGLIVFTHERYLVLAPIVLMAFWYAYKGDKKQKIRYGILILMPDFVNVLFKTLVVRSQVLVGTGGNNISFNFGQIFSYILESIEILFGINNGPQYLNGYSFVQSSKTNKSICVLIAGILLILIISYVINNIKKKNYHELLKLGIAVLLVGALMASYCVTIRVEMRWVYAPYIIFMAYIIYILYMLEWSKYIKNTMLILLTVLILVTNYNCRQYSSEIFFVKSMKNAQQVYDLTVKEYGESITEYPIYLLEDSEVYWAIGGSVGGSTVQTTAQTLNQFIDGEVTVEWKSSLDELEQVKENEEKYIILLRDENNNYYSIVKDGE